MTPSSLLSGATPGRFTFAEASTIGRAEEVSNVSVSPETLDEGSGDVQIFHHQCKRLLFAIFSIAEFAHSRSVSCVARKVVATKSFYGDDIAGRQHRRGAANACFVAAHCCVTGL